MACAIASTVHSGVAHAAFSRSAAATSSDRKTAASVADDLAGFVAFARDQQDVAALERRNGARIASRRSPISVAPGAAARIARGSRRLFAARIVVGDDHAVGLLRGDRAHQRALALIAVAAGAKHDDEPAASRRDAAPSSAFASASGLCA